jgi:glycosyltransferase involved in cell wall biosynthesis
MSGGARCRLAVLASHPVQYFTPLYQRLAAEPGLDVEVMFYRDFGVRMRYDKQFGRAIRWDTDLVSGYRHRFLLNLSPIPDTFNPLHAVNPGAFVRLLRRFDAVWLNGYAYPSNWLDPSRRPRRLDPVRDAVVRWWVRRSDALLYIGDANRRAYLAYGARPEQLFFTPYSVDVDRIADVRRRADGDRAELRRRWRVPPDRLVVLFVGKLTERKHPEAALSLVRSDQGSRPVHVVIAAPSVSFLGFVNQSALPEVYALADIFVMPSEREPWGLVLNEAMAAGLAPVVSDGVGAAVDLITHGETGFVFPSRDWSALEAAVRILAADDGLRARVAAAAAARSHANNFGVAVRGILEALDGVGAFRGARGAATKRERAGRTSAPSPS